MIRMPRIYYEKFGGRIRRRFEGLFILRRAGLEVFL